MNKRIVYFDLLKLFAVLLVIVGHVISQYDSRGYSHPINVWIYSFHMPLFMFLNGLFFHNTLKKPFKEVVRSKSIQLLLPLVSWSIINLIVNELIEIPILEWDKAIWQYLTSFGPLHGLWYLKCLFLYLVICYLAVKLLRNEYLASLSTMVLFLLLPNVNFLSQMIVFFWAGFFYNKAGDILLSDRGIQRLILRGSSVIMILILSLLWKPDCSYLHGAKPFFESLLFIMTGVSSSLFWVTVFKWKFQGRETRWIQLCSNMGACSLGIYCCQEYFYTPHLWSRILNPYGNTVFYIFWSIIILIICYGLVLVLQKNRYTSLLFLGIYHSRK